MTQESERPKKTRRRLRVSCVECTRRRQKCDRTQPCGLCKRRGVEHLCRWEVEPYARPPPARPSGSRKSENRSSTGKRSPAESQLSTERGDTSMSPREMDFAASIGTLEHEVKEAAIALAQLSVARHGEYLGTGSLVCALHRLNDSSETKVPIDKSSGVPFSSRNQYSSAISDTFTGTLQNLIKDFPIKSHCDILISGFFEQDNWRYGLPEALIMSVYNAMWDTIEADRASMERINFNWVTCLFAMFALSSSCSSEEESRKYFLQALTSKRLVEDVQSASFFTPRDSGTFSQGTAHSCIAAALMAEYLCDRGQMTEAWKLVGSGVRNAQNAGLHLNPAWNKWKDMTENERVLRILGWHMCALKDRFLSFTLGRPTMVHSRDYYVPFKKTPLPALAADGSSDTTCPFNVCLITLFESVSEEKDKYFCVRPDRTDGGDSFNAKISVWERTLPTYLSARNPNTSYDHLYPRLRSQRVLLSCYHHFCCMLFHRSLPCIKLLTGSSEEMIYKHHQWDFDNLTRYAIDLLHAQRCFIGIIQPQRQLCFTASYFVFEAAVTLSIAICRDSCNPNVREWRKERDGAIDLLQSVLNMDNSELTQQAIVVLRILQDKRPGAAGTSSESDTEMQEIEVDDAPTTTSSDFAWPLFEPQDAILSSMFPMDTSQLQGSSGLVDQIRSNVESTSSLSGFDFLFNSVTTQ